MPTINEVINLVPKSDVFNYRSPQKIEVLSVSNASWAKRETNYEDKVFNFLFINKTHLELNKVFRLKNNSLDGELELLNGDIIPIEIKLRMNWLKARQVEWQFRRFQKNNPQVSFTVGIVFFEDFSGDWAIKAKSRDKLNGWERWYTEHFQNGLTIQLIRLKDNQIETYNQEK